MANETKTIALEVQINKINKTLKATPVFVQLHAH